MNDPAPELTAEEALELKRIMRTDDLNAEPDWSALIDFWAKKTGKTPEDAEKTVALMHALHLTGKRST